MCPSDDFRNDSGGLFVMLAFNNASSDRPRLGGWLFGGTDVLAPTSYLASQGAAGDTNQSISSNNRYYVGKNNWRDFKGLFTPRSKNRFRDLQDGSSNTIAFGESTGGNAYNWSWIGSGTMPTWGAAAYPQSFDEAWFKFNSKHIGGFQIAMADGSVRFVSYNMNQNVFTFQLSGMADGITVENF